MAVHCASSMAAAAVVVELDQDTEGCDPMTEGEAAVAAKESECASWKVKWKAQAASSAEAERLFFTNALGLMQGWAWSDLVEARFRLIQKALPPARDVQLLGAFVATAALTFILIFLRIAASSESRRRISLAAPPKPAKQLV